MDRKRACAGNAAHTAAHKITGIIAAALQATRRLQTYGRPWSRGTSFPSGIAYRNTSPKTSWRQTSFLSPKLRARVGGLGFILLTQLVGCATNSDFDAIQKTTPPLASGLARIVVMRTNSVAQALGMIGGIHVYVDEKDYGELKARSFVVVDVQSGPHEVRVNKPPPFAGAMPLRAQRTFVGYSGESTYWEAMPFYDGHTNTVSVYFRNITQQAMSEK